MLHRFAAACIVGAGVIATGALATLLLSLPAEGTSVLTLAWCFVPVVWGFWAMLAPEGWLPNRLPAWGAILGIGAGIVAGPLLDLPGRFGAPSGARWLVPLIGPVLYYPLWLLVRATYCSLRVTGRTASEATVHERVV